MSHAWHSSFTQKRTLDRRYAWKATNDSSGCFQGRHFQFQDLQASAKKRTWPEGIVFVNVHSGEILSYSDGQLVKACKTGQSSTTGVTKRVGA